MNQPGRRWRLCAYVGLCLGLAACATTGGVEVVRGTPPLDRSATRGLTADDFRAAVFTADDGTTLPYRLLAPARLEPGRRYPLVVQFHNSGAIGRDNRAQIERDISARAWALPAIRARHPAFVLVPQFPVRSADYDDPQAPRSAHAGPPLASALAMVAAIAREHPIDPDRIYASGFSMGGSTTWLAALERPGLFAAAVPIGAVAPDRGLAGKLTALPLLVLHGDQDHENPIQSDRDMVAAIRRAGGRQARLREYAGLAHQPPGDLIPGHWWRDWLFAQRRTPQ
jgi:predicted peptidase